MRWNILFLLAVGGSILVNNTAEASSRTRSAYCMQGPTSPGLSNCTFTSYQQCQASASGRFLYCVANPYYNPGGGFDPRGYRGPRVRSVYPSY